MERSLYGNVDVDHVTEKDFYHLITLTLLILDLYFDFKISEQKQFFKNLITSNLTIYRMN